MKETQRMEWEMASAAAAAASGGERGYEAGEGRGGGGATAVDGEGILCVKVMTDEQMEVLRRQIAVYGTICEQLVEMHKVVTAHHDSLAGMRLGGLFGDPLMASGCQKTSTRQRWTPTTMQLQILENMFNRGITTPNKQEIKEMTTELSQHGPISESNVYNWFQNRKARSKRKQIASLPSNAESEHEADEDSLNEKKSKHNEFGCEDLLPAKVNDHPPIYSMQTYSEAQSLGMKWSNDSSRSSNNLGQMSLYGNVMSTNRLDHLMEKYGVPSFSPCPGESYDIMGWLCTGL